MCVEFRVSIYYFHLRNGEDVLLDPDGREMATLHEVERAALSDARSVISHDALEGRIDMSYRIDVVDAAGLTVHSLGFAEAVEIARG